MKNLSGITRRHEQFHLTYGVSDETDHSHENISLVFVRSSDITKTLGGFGENGDIHLEVRYVDPTDPNNVLRELSYGFTQESFQTLIDAMNSSAEDFTILCKQECYVTNEITEVEFVLPLKDNRRLDVFIQRFIVLVRAISNGALDVECPYDFNINQPIAEA